MLSIHSFFVRSSASVCLPRPSTRVNFRRQHTQTESHILETWTRNGSEFAFIGPPNKQLILDAFHQLSEDSRQRRFFASRDALSEADLNFLTIDADMKRHYAVSVAAKQDDSTYFGVGEGRYVQTQLSPDTVEVAVSIADSQHGKGLGAKLFDHLVIAAAKNGYTYMQALMDPSNRAMKTLITSRCWQNVKKTYELDGVLMSFRLEDSLPVLLSKERDMQEAAGKGEQASN
eukprot:comp5974_c0_seq1/m.1824 comp5974_c0_seq1/g.1824  ORF comp5974_c0_seq1/g.1824 comp5974_c0_seq1/m.1824 type:complete len:231 (-) comp5974_c0_seq1:411-1103(-)